MSALNATPADYLQTRGLEIPSYARPEHREKSAEFKGSGTAFAQGLREFPLHDPYSTWHSYALASVKGASMDVHDALLDAGEAHGIADDLEKIAQAVHKATGEQLEGEERAKTAAEADLASLEYHALPERQLWPINNRLNVQKSAHEVVDHLPLMTATELHTACTNTLANARRFKVAHLLPRQIEKYATARYCDPALVLPEIDDRIKLASAEWHETYTLLKEAAEAATSDRSASLNMADTLLETDKCAGIQNWYGKGLTHPLELLYSGMTDEDVEKSASELVELCDRQIPCSALAHIPKDILGTAFRAKVAHAVDALILGSGDRELIKQASSLLTEGEQRRLLNLAMEFAPDADV